MARPRVRPLLKVECAYCHAELIRPLDKRRKNTFCNREHFGLFKRGKPPINKYRNRTLIDEYRRVALELGHPPLLRELKKHSRIYPSIFTKRFGTLDNIAKIALDGFDPNKPKDKWSIDSITPEDGGWLAGICAGESCFRMQKRRTEAYDAVFHIQLRADDANILMEIKRLWKIDKPLGVWNREKDRSRGINAGDGIVLSIRDIPTIFSRIVPTFERYPMRGKKQVDFELFKRGAAILYKKRSEGRRNSCLTDEERKELGEIFLALKDVKKYKSNIDEIMLKYSAVRIGK